MDIKKIFIQWKYDKKKLINRIKKNNIAINIGIRILAITIISIVATQIIPLSPTAKANIQEYAILKKIAQIDDIAHEQDVMLDEFGDGYSMKRDNRFHIIDNKYHTTQYRDEKYHAAEELNTLIKEQSTFLYQVIGSGNAFSDLAKKKFDALQKEFEGLKM